MARIFDAGKLDKRVTLQKYLGDTETGYTKPDNWQDVATLWANINAVGDRSFYAAQSAHAELTHKVTIRYRPGVSADMRFLYGERILEIVSPPIDYDEQHMFLILRCREVAT